MSKQTAVEFLFKHLECVKIIDGYEFIKLQQVFEQAKAMECGQIIEAFYDGEENAHKYKSSPLLYYNETYKGGEQ